jgi:hypothetical protein
MARGRCARAGQARARGVSRLVCAGASAHRKEAGARSHLLRAHSCMRAWSCEQAQRFGRADVRAARRSHCGALAIQGCRALCAHAQRKQATALGWVVPVGTAASLWGAWTHHAKLACQAAVGRARGVSPTACRRKAARERPGTRAAAVNQSVCPVAIVERMNSRYQKINAHKTHAPPLSQHY